MTANKNRNIEYQIIFYDTDDMYFKRYTHGKKSNVRQGPCLRQSIPFGRQDIIMTNLVSSFHLIKCD